VAEGSGEWLAPTDSTQLHGAVVQAQHGTPISGARVRVLCVPRLRLFTAEEVASLGKSLYLFDDSATGATDDKGMFSLAPPLYLAYYSDSSSAEGIRGHVVVSAAGAKPYAASFHPDYARGESAYGYKSSWGKVKASYMPLLAVVPDTFNDKTPLMESLQQLRVEGPPPIVRAGQSFDLRVTWKFVMMPFLKSDLKVAGGKAVRQSVSGEAGQVVETWLIKGLKASKQPGQSKVDVRAFLDAPRMIISPCGIKAPYLVAQSDAEAEAYLRINNAIKEYGGDDKPSPATVCAEIVKSQPAFAFGWECLARALKAERKWQELIDLWEQLPKSVRQQTEFVMDHCLALDKAGHKDRALEAVTQLTKTGDASAEEIEKLINVAIIAKKFDVVKELAADKRTDASVRDWALWCAGERPKGAAAAIHAAKEFYARDRTQEGLDALGTVAAGQLKGELRSNYYLYLIILHLDAKNPEAAAEAIAAWQKADKKSGEHLYLKARIAIAKEDFATAIPLLVKEEKSTTESRQAPSKSSTSYFTLAIKELVKQRTGNDPSASAWGAYSLLAAHQFTDAAELATAAVRDQPNSAVANLALGLALEMSGDFAKAVGALDKASRDAPEDPYLKRELARARSLSGGTP
jgi:uncharacterized protein HemY